MQNQIILDSITDAKNYFLAHIRDTPTDSPYSSQAGVRTPETGSFFGQDGTLYVWNWIGEGSKIHVQVLNISLPSMVFFI